MCRSILGFFDEVEIGAGAFEAEVFAHSGVFAVADASCQLGDQLDPLRFAAADHRAGLAELEVSQAGVAHQPQGAVDLAVGAEEIGGFVDDFARLRIKFPPQVVRHEPCERRNRSAKFRQNLLRRPATILGNRDKL